uniref:Reverse transcriptase domain-containing protein n=1 Tax=Schistosoma mansoni TaxID=6183 RepID=A0A5K4F595_SCHMA
MEPQNTRYETTHSLDALISDVNENELMEFSSYDPDQFIQTHNPDNNDTFENEKHIVLNTTEQNQENSVVNIDKDEVIISEIRDEIQCSNDNIVNEIPTTIIKSNLDGINESTLFDDDVFLNGSNDDDDANHKIRIEHDDYQYETERNQNELIKQEENIPFIMNEEGNGDHIPPRRKYTLTSFELSVSPPNVSIPKLPGSSRNKTLPIIKRKPKKTSSFNPNQVHVRGKRFKSDNDYSIFEESTLKLPPIISKNPNEQSFVQINENDEKGNNKLKQSSNANNNMNNNDVDNDEDNESEENVIAGIEHSLSFNTPVKCSMESVDKLPFITDSNENKVTMSTLNIVNHDVYSDDHTCLDGDFNGPLTNDDDSILLKVDNSTNDKRHSIIINLEPILPIIETNNNNSMVFETFRKNSIPLSFSKPKGYWPNKTARIDKDVQFAFVPINQSDASLYSANEPTGRRPIELKSERSTIRKQPIGQISQTNSDSLELAVIDSLKKVQKAVKDNVLTHNPPIKRPIKPRPNPDDFCMTMWSYQEVKQEEVPLPELLKILLSGKPDLISKRVFGEIQPHRNLAQELRTAIETIYRVLPKSHAFGSIANLIGIRPGYKLETQILKHGHTQKEYKNILIKTLRDAYYLKNSFSYAHFIIGILILLVKHSTMQQVISNQQNHDLEKLIIQIADVCSIVATELIGSDTAKPGKHFTGVNLETLIMNLVKGAVYDTPLANRGVLSGLLAAAGGGIEALMGLIGSVGGGVEGLARLLASGANPSEALGELLKGLDDDPVKALKQLANAMGGGVDGIKNILNALGGDKQTALKELIKQVGGGAEGLKNLFEAAGSIKELMESLFGEGSEGLAGLIAAAGGELEGLKNLIQAAGGGVEGIRNLIGLGGDHVTGLKNLLTAIGGDNVADALSTLIKAAGGVKDGLSALLQESGGGLKGLENLLEAVGGGVEGLKNLLKATGDDPSEALANILAAAGGGVEGLKNLLEAVGGGAEGLKNLLNAMGDNPNEALANILKASGGGSEALKNLLESIGGGAEGLQTLLQALGGDPAQALASLIASVGGGEEGLRNFIEAVGGGASGLTNLLKSLGGSTKEALEALLTASGGGIEGLKNLVSAAGGGAEGLKNIIEAAGGGLEGLKNLLSSLGDEPVESLKSLLTSIGGGVANLITASGGGASGLKNLFDAVGGGVQGLTNLLSALSSDMNEALINLLNVTGNQEEDFKNLIEALGGGVEGLENLFKVIGDKVGIEGLLKTLGGGAKGLATLLNSFGENGNKEEIIRKLIEISGGGVEGLAALLKSAGGSIDSIKEILNAFGGGHEALAKLLASCGDNPAEALKVLLEMLGGDENALRNLLLASGLDPNDPNALKLLFESLGGADVGLTILVNAMGGGEEGMKRLLKTLGDDGLANLITAAGGGENGMEALIKAIGGKGVEGLTALINLLGGKENGLATLIAAAGGGQVGLAALLKAAGKFAEDGDGLAALIAAAGGGAEGLEALINAAGGDEEGLNNLLQAAGATDSNSKANILKTLINAGGGGQEGFNNLLKILTRGKHERPIDGLANLLKVLGNNPDTLGILLEAIGGNSDGLADILAAAGGGAEALQLLINAAGGGAEGLVNLLAAAKLDNLQQLADVLAAAGLSDDLVSAARSGNLSEFSDLVARNAAEENYIRTRSAKELCREEKEWLRTRPTGPINFIRKLTTIKQNYRKWKKLTERASAAQKELDLTVLPEFSQSTIESSLLNLHPYQQCNQERLNKFATQLNSNILKSLKAQMTRLDKEIDFDLKETDLLDENLCLEEQRLRQEKEEDENQTFDLSKSQLFSEEERRKEEELLLESKRLIEAFDNHVIMRKKLRDEEIIAKYKTTKIVHCEVNNDDKFNLFSSTFILIFLYYESVLYLWLIMMIISSKVADQDELVIPELEGFQHTAENVDLHEVELGEVLTEVTDEEEEEEDKELEETHEDLRKSTRVKSRLLIVHDLLRESIGLERNLKITPAFVWSYFELLRKMDNKLQLSVSADPGDDDRMNSSLDVIV